MSFLTAAFRGLLKCTSRLQACSMQVTCDNAAKGVKSIQQQYSIPQRCLTLPPEKERGLKKRGKFNPSAWKRLHKHGIEAALTTSSGRKRLFNRMLRGKHNLTVYDHFLAVKPSYSKTKKQLRHGQSVSKPLQARHNAGENSLNEC